MNLFATLNGEDILNLVRNTSCKKILFYSFIQIVSITLFQSKMIVKCRLIENMIYFFIFIYRYFEIIRGMS